VAAWKEQSSLCRLYLLVVYLAAIPCAFLCFKASNNFSPQWLLLALLSIFVATINVRLPKLSAVISMGDVFIIVILIQFGPFPALTTYWLDTAVATVTDLFRRHGFRLKDKILLHKWLFNLACCALSTWAMFAAYRGVGRLGLPKTINLLVELFAIALSWFIANTVTVSLALAFWSKRHFWSVWREGVALYLLNFVGSAAVAGLVRVFYEQVGFLVFLLCVPIAVVLYQLYHFSIEKYEQAQKHIKELNELYLQTIDALASAVDAKDRYTHGHIRRVQAYAVELAKWCGIRDQKELLAIQAGALLHDIGKIAIPEYILNKPTTLTESEYEKMKIHPVVGANMLSTIEFPYPLIPLVRSHHERWDGNGYPDRLTGEQIPLSARILSLVDCYDALTTNRPYRSPMTQGGVIEFFRREAGRAYDPKVVQTFVENIEQIEAAGKAVVTVSTDVWGIKDSEKSDVSSTRPLEKVQPILTYGKALNADADIQRELYSAFEFARADFHCLTPNEIFSFMGRRLSNLVEFDSAVFYEADLERGVVIARYTSGENTSFFEGLTLPLEQKLTGWVAANNQSLCNLPPFPDFLNLPDPKPLFQISAIAPMNRQKQVLGAISLYRKEMTKFTEEQFRRLEIVASQTAILLAKCRQNPEGLGVLTDSTTDLPNGLHLYLMFDPLVIDATRYEYPLVLISLHLEDISSIRKKWGHVSGDEAIRTAANYLRKELRETDLLVRYAEDEFIAVNPRMSREQAENLKSRLQNDLDHFRFAVRTQTPIPLRVSIGIAVFPDDGSDLEQLLSASSIRMDEDRELRSAVRRGIRHISPAT
jgi:diguanylate cyclase (GGDEF)-like protein/putative nucleotidyltransferase with HDIG domain